MPISALKHTYQLLSIAKPSRLWTDKAVYLDKVVEHA